MQTRIYTVRSLTHEKPWLVEATSAAQAIRHVVSSEYMAQVATTKEVAQCMAHGILVQKANAQDPRPIESTEASPEQHAN